MVRRGISGSTFGGGSPDQLPARGALGLAAKAAVGEGHTDAVTGFRTEAIERDTEGRLVLVGEDGRRLDAADRVELALPETGVCGGAGFFDTPAPSAAAPTVTDVHAPARGCCGS